jgi:hypothetical protein
MEINPIQNILEPELPPVFCVEYMKGMINGYAYIESTIIISDEGQRIHVLKSKDHEGHFFRLINNRAYVLEHQTIWKTSISKKRFGRVNRPMRWRNTGEALRYNNIDYPVIRIATSSLVLPIIPAGSFIPLRQNGAPILQPVNVVVEEKKIQISKIPQHAIRALLRDAAMEETACPITGEDIDITNGAVTSCFHLFDKDAIATWMNMPISHDKCPVCNMKCLVYNLDENPPGLIIRL